MLIVCKQGGFAAEMVFSAAKVKRWACLQIGTYQHGGALLGFGRGVACPEMACSNQIASRQKESGDTC